MKILYSFFLEKAMLFLIELRVKFSRGRALKKEPAPFPLHRERRNYRAISLMKSAFLNKFIWR